MFPFRFADQDDCARILEGGPWFFEGRPIILRQWQQEQGIACQVPDALPLWVQLPNLPHEWWSEEGIATILCFLGNPLYLDTPTTNRSHFAFARGCVQVDIKASLPSSMPIECQDGSMFELGLEYDSLPPSCTKCKCLGHLH